jgi:hypothetical protein
MARDELSRRWFFACLSAGGGAGLLMVGQTRMPLAQDRQLAVTPHCVDEPTPIQTEGPYYLAQSRESKNLREGVEDIPFVLSEAFGSQHLSDSPSYSLFSFRSAPLPFGLPS